MDETTNRSVILCIPTYRRPDGIRKLLNDVAHLDYRGPLSVIVVENDLVDRAGDAVVKSIIPLFPFLLSCIVEPTRGQTYAYNRAFQEACRSPHGADYVAVLDDDEYPDRAWLTRMVETAVRFDADIVGGPVLPVFENPGHWLAKTNIYGPASNPTGRIGIIYGAGNMLIRRQVLQQYLDQPFPNEYAFTGGSDFYFFKRCQVDGRSFAWADDARVFETTPSARTSFSWILRRGFRNGTDRTRVEKVFVRGPGPIFLRWMKGFAMLFSGIAVAPIAILGGRARLAKALLTAARGAGRIAAEFHVIFEEYR